MVNEESNKLIVISSLIDIYLGRVQEYLEFAIQLAQDAGAIIKSAIDSRMTGTGVSHVHVKKDNPSDLVTETDKAVEEFIKERLKKTYPHHR